MKATLCQYTVKQILPPINEFKDLGAEPRKSPSRANGIVGSQANSIGSDTV